MCGRGLLLVVIIGIVKTSVAGPRKINGYIPDDVQQQIDTSEVIGTKYDDADVIEEDSTTSSVFANNTNDDYYDENLTEKPDNGSQYKIEMTHSSADGPESKIPPKGKKRRKLTKSANKSKKLLEQLLPLLLIPLMIQAQIIPVMLFKLKLMAVKALMVGKAALLIILFNVVKNYMNGSDTKETQYEHETLASSHYGYTGSPEFGAWINKRWDSLQPERNTPYRGQVPKEATLRKNAIQSTTDPEENT